MNSFNVEYNHLEDKQKNKLRTQCKIIMIMLPFVIGISLYFLISTEPIQKADQILIYNQNTQLVKDTLIVEQNTIASKVLLQVYQDCKHELTFTIEDSELEYFSLPSQSPFPTTKCQKEDNIVYNYQLSQNSFNVNIEQESIIKIEQYLISKDHSSVSLQFINSSNLYGFGEQFSSLQIKQNQYYYLWPTLQTQKSGLGYHPMWLQKQNNHKFYAGLLQTSSQLRYILNGQTLKIDIYGGKLIFKIFLYENAEQCIKAYHRYINGYKLFPIWTLGFQYFADVNNVTTEMIDEFINIFNQRSIPIETIYLNTNNNVKRQDIRIIKNVPLTVEENTIKKQYLIKSGDDNKPLVGKLYKQNVNYLDFNKQQEDILINIHDSDGVYLMNNEMILQDENNNYQSIPLNSYHYHKKNAILIKSRINEQYFRPLNNLAQQLQYQNTVIVSSSTFYGSGKYAMTIFNTTDYQNSISTALLYQFYGVPYVGMNGCDQGVSHLDICSKWLSIQSWMPIFRAESTKYFTLNNEDYYNVIQKELDLRSKLIRWMFTQFINNYDKNIDNLSGTILQPIWWQYPNDSLAYQFENQEFIFANTYLIAPLLRDPIDDTFTSWQVYFPKYSDWMQIHDGVLFQGGNQVEFNLLTSTQTPIFQKTGTIVFKQVPTLRVEQLNNKFILCAVMDKSGIAQGILLTISNTDQNLIQKCLSQNCIAKYKLIVHGYGKDIQLELEIEKQQEDTFFEEIIITQIEVHHAPHQWEYIKNLDPPLIINREIKQFI